MMPVRDCLWSFSFSVLLALGGAAVAPAQSVSDTPPAETTMFPHPDSSRWWLSGQANLISQAHGRFTSPTKGTTACDQIQNRPYRASGRSTQALDCRATQN